MGEAAETSPDTSPRDSDSTSTPRGGAQQSNDLHQGSPDADHGQGGQQQQRRGQFHAWGVPSGENDQIPDERTFDELREEYADPLCLYRLRRRHPRVGARHDDYDVIRSFIQALLDMPARKDPRYRQLFAEIVKLRKHHKRILAQMSAEIRPQQEREFNAQLVYRLLGTSAPIVRITFVAAHGVDFHLIYKFVILHNGQRFELLLDLRNPQILGPKLDPFKLSPLRQVFCMLFYEATIGSRMLTDAIMLEAESLLKRSELILDFPESLVSIKVNVELVPDNERSILLAVP